MHIWFYTGIYILNNCLRHENSFKMEQFRFPKRNAKSIAVTELIPGQLEYCL